MTKPEGMFHHKRDFAMIKIPHFIILEHQKTYPDLRQRMKANPENATNIYTAFLLLLALQAKGVLTPELKTVIMKNYKLI